MFPLNRKLRPTQMGFGRIAMPQSTCSTWALNQRGRCERTTLSPAKGGSDKKRWMHCCWWQTWCSFKGLNMAILMRKIMINQRTEWGSLFWDITYKRIFWFWSYIITNFLVLQFIPYYSPKIGESTRKINKNRTYWRDTDMFKDLLVDAFWVSKMGDSTSNQG